MYMICLLFFISFLANEAICEQCACATESLHVRSGAGTGYPILASMPGGDCRPDKGGRTHANGFEWANINYNGHNAWAADKWLQFKPCASHSTGTHTTSGCHIISRAGWGARTAKHPLRQLPHTPNHIYIHHGATPSCHTKSACTTMVKSYQNYHMDGHGYSDIEYSFVVGEDGNVYEGRGWDHVGAHTLHHNTDGLGVCVVGDFTNHLPNNAAINAVKNLIKCGVSMGKITSNYILKGHRDVGATACPGTKFYDLIKTWPHYHH